jgi:hypothetical protein
MYGNKILSHGYYWSNFIEEVKNCNGELPKIGIDGWRLINKVANKIMEHFKIPFFYVIDIAKTWEGQWLLIEVNNGFCSGIQECNIHELYKNLSELEVQ